MQRVRALILTRAALTHAQLIDRCEGRCCCLIFIDGCGLDVRRRGRRRRRGRGDKWLRRGVNRGRGGRRVQRSRGVNFCPPLRTIRRRIRALREQPRGHDGPCIYQYAMAAASKNGGNQWVSSREVVVVAVLFQTRRRRNRQCRLKSNLPRQAKPRIRARQMRSRSSGEVQQLASQSGEVTPVVRSEQLYPGALAALSVSRRLSCHRRPKS